MGRESKYSAEVKVQAIEDYFSGKRSVVEIANDLSVDPKTVWSWIRRYTVQGIEVFGKSFVSFYFL